MRSRNCLDFAIIAGGYNSVNECLLLRLPSSIIQIQKQVEMISQAELPGHRNRWCDGCREGG